VLLAIKLNDSEKNIMDIMVETQLRGGAATARVLKA